MNDSEFEALLNAWTIHLESGGKEDDDTFEQAYIVWGILPKEDPEAAWRFILAVTNRVTSPEALGLVGAGALEDLLSYHGEKFIDRVEVEALRNERFRDALSHVWKSNMHDEVWNRLYKLFEDHLVEWGVEPLHPHSTMDNQSHAERRRHDGG